MRSCKSGQNSNRSWRKLYALCTISSFFVVFFVGEVPNVLKILRNDNLYDKTKIDHKYSVVMVGAIFFSACLMRSGSKLEIVKQSSNSKRIPYIYLRVIQHFILVKCLERLSNWNNYCWVLRSFSIGAPQFDHVAHQS